MFSDVDSADDPGLAVAYLESAATSLAGVKRDLVNRLHVEPGERVLDVGCGAGHDLALLAAVRAVVFGVDTSARMIQESRRRCPEAEVMVGDGASLPCASGSFDACRIERVLQHVRDPHAVLQEAARVLRRGGRIVVFEPDWGSFAIDSHSAGAQTAITNAVMMGVRHPRVGLQLRRLLVEAGFTVEEVVVDVGRYTGIADIRRFVDLNTVCSRAVASGWLEMADVRSWDDEMSVRSRNGTFQGTLNRMIAVART
jgi:SAM-dependent methyltransferase